MRLKFALHFKIMVRISVEGCRGTDWIILWKAIKYFHNIQSFYIYLEILCRHCFIRCGSLLFSSQIHCLLNSKVKFIHINVVSLMVIPPLLERRKSIYDQDIYSSTRPYAVCRPFMSHLPTAALQPFNHLSSHLQVPSLSVWSGPIMVSCVVKGLVTVQSDSLLQILSPNSPGEQIKTQRDANFHHWWKPNSSGSSKHSQQEWRPCWGLSFET